MTSIRRRDWIAGGLAGAAALSWMPAARAFQKSTGRKNLLILMADQHKRDCLGVAGNPVVRTPNLDALARSSVRFTDAYCANPVCTPSRASLLTGLYTHNHQTWNNATPWPYEHKTIAHAFGRAGYMTGLIGKMHFVDAQTHGFDYHLDFNDWYQFLGPKTRLYADELARPNSGSGLPQIDDLWRDEGDPWRDVRENDGRQGSVAVGRVSRIPEQDQFESFVARESVRFLRTHGRKQPFLLISSFLKPHDPFMPAERFANMFRPEDMRLPDTWGKVDLSRVPEEVRNSIRHNGPTPELSNEAEARKRIALYYAGIAQMDDALGKVLAALRELDLEKDTAIVYTSDHGEMLGEHGLWQKFEFYESSCGVPLLIRDPAIAAGAVCRTPVSLVQLLPTLCELCDVTPVGPVDGASIAGDLRAPGRTRDTKVFAEYNLRNYRAKYMLRHGDYKYSFWANDIAELYNLRTDPKEMNNLAGLPENKGKEEELKAELFAWYKPPEIGLKPGAKLPG
ncbi:MAG: sulfatase-like hydrolase/transferase [Acidobacteria bacterium]|nr:sulfatase-like hydrolase/transferase [Acidobacteriota bacterium]